MAAAPAPEFELASTETAGWHTRPPAEVLARLGSDGARGLAAAEARARLAAAGPNALAEGKQEAWWEEIVESLTEPLVLMLLGVGALYALLGQIEDALTIFAVIVAVASIEIASEARARRAIGALRTLSAPTATTIRDGTPREVPARELVPGDLVLLEPGDRVPADVRLVEATALRADESSLTGESVPVAKQADAELAADAELGDRRTMLYAGTTITAGKGRGVVVATGRATELGRIAGLVASAREPRTPLQLHLKQLAGWLVWVALGFSVLVPLLGILVARRPWQEMLLTGLTLAFATIPEELPILITIVLGLGAYRLAQERAIVKRLRAAETLGSVSVIGTDKTGTLTENRMRVAELFLPGDSAPRALAEGAGSPHAHRLLEIGVLASDAQVQRVDGRLEYVGDPTETALLAAAEAAGRGVAAVRGAVRTLVEYPFDDGRRRMSVVVEREGERWLLLKGAPESVLAVCAVAAGAAGTAGAGADSAEANGRERTLAVADRMAGRGLRVLAFAERRLEPGERLPDDALAVERDATLVGLAGLEDPPRPEVPGAVAALQAAGVRVLLLTGDHPATAAAIAERVGIDARTVVRGRDLDALVLDGTTVPADPATIADAEGLLPAGGHGLADRRGVAQANLQALGALATSAAVFARITPEHKLRLVEALQARGEVVAVTGDGVNDGPALRAAAVGVAMGKSGTDVAREAADLVLADDNFATVATAVRAGRTLYENLRKAVRYYLAAKVALVVASLVAVLAQLPVPFSPVQIIVLELFMDLGASVTFTAEPPEEDVMARPPRDPKRPFLDQGMRLGILAGGLSLALAVVVPYLWAWWQGGSLAQAQTAAFAAWLVGHVVLAAHMRAERQPLLRTNPLANRPFLVWAGAAVALVAVGLSVPFLQARLHLAPLDPSTWAVVLASALLLPSWWEPYKWTRHRASR